MAGRRDTPLPSLEPTPVGVKLQCGEPWPYPVVCNGRPNLSGHRPGQSPTVQAPCSMLCRQLILEAPSSFIRRRSSIIAGRRPPPISPFTD